MNLNDYNLTILDSVSALRDNSEAWDDLWIHSSVATPLSRAAFIAQWVEHFSPTAKFLAIIVKKNERFYAALPLVKTVKAKFISTGMNPSNAWSMCGEFLIVQDDDFETVMDVFVGGLLKLPFSILWLDYLRMNEPQWMGFREALKKNRIPSHWLPRYSVGVVSVRGDFNSLSSTWKKSQIQRIQKKISKLYEPRTYQLKLFENPEDLQEMLPRCIQLEHLGWKGCHGGSIVKRNMESFFDQQVQLLAKYGAMRLFTLWIDDTLIAYKYCFYSKNCFFSLKTSFHPEYAKFSPGQVLQYLIFQAISSNEISLKFDFVGELSDNQKIWNTDESISGQVVIPLNSIVGRIFFKIYDSIMPILRRYKLFH